MPLNSDPNWPLSNGADWLFSRGPDWTTPLNSGPDWWTIIFSLVGALIGGTATFLAVWYSHKKDTDQENVQFENTIQGFYQAIYDEINITWNMYQEGMGTVLEAMNDGDPLLSRYPVIQDYFTIYHGNSHLIGQITDNDIRIRIVQTYALAKGLIDSFLINNQLIDTYNQYDRDVNMGTENLERPREECRQVLVQYVDSLKDLHGRAKESVERLLHLLVEQGIIANNNN